MKLVLLWFALIAVLLKVAVADLQAEPLPPFPKQYSALFNFSFDVENPDQLYVDIIEARRVRTDVTGSSSYTVLNDLQTFNTYLIYPAACYCQNNLRNPYVPFMYFPFVNYMGLVSCFNLSKTFCNKWNGCHPYEIPPAPFYLEATVSNNVPLYINFPSIHNYTVYFQNYIPQKPNQSLFTLPQRCANVSCTNNNKEIMNLHNGDKDNKWKKVYSMLFEDIDLLNINKRMIC